MLLISKFSRMIEEVDTRSETKIEISHKSKVFKLDFRDKASYRVWNYRRDSSSKGLNGNRPRRCSFKGVRRFAGLVVARGS